jgi:type IV conjugative transfer system lipoprotein TraV
MKSQLKLKATQPIALACLLLSLGGCAKFFNPVGENNYDCNRKENPNSPYCHSFRSVDKATSNDVPDSRYDQNMNIADMDRLTGIAPVGETDITKSKTTANNKADTVYTTTHNSDRPVAARQDKEIPVFGYENSTPPDGSPVRVGPVVQRIWIKSFPDSNDMLTSDQVVYKEIEPTHWAGHRTARNAVAGVSSSGLTGAYPHKAVEPVETADPQAGAPTSPGESTNNSSNDNFSQPGTQRRSDETAPTLPDSSGSSMPN